MREEQTNPNQGTFCKIPDQYSSSCQGYQKQTKAENRSQSRGPKETRLLKCNYPEWDPGTEKG